MPKHQKKQKTSPVRQTSEVSSKMAATYSPTVTQYHRRDEA